MAKVSLRIYNREIESLIDQGRLDEAVAHCRHILQTFSKHLETYRLLGKAYLEAKRYEEAVDVFSRVLMAVPDDFVSHVGMSIIRDDQNKLDEAIWHMERAFEAQPSNAAIQSELQRLFGRRDGVEPPKIRMTRGALAHMYIQGELYHQAISEIKAVLAQDSQRDDMKTLLARAYFHSGQRADASDVCGQLLNHYPYAFDANRIMLELLQGSETAENAQLYRHRVYELDPYAAHAQGSVFRSNEVPDAAVSLDRFEYRGEQMEPEKDWRTAGISLEPGESQQEPEWLRAEPGAAPAEEAEPPAAPEIPQFLREAGWVESSGHAEEPAPFEPEARPGAAEELAPAELPDWLKAMAPSEPEPPAETAAVESSDWLADLRNEAPAAPEAGQAGIPDWLSALEAEENEAAPSTQAAPLPDWLHSASAPAVEGPVSSPVEGSAPETEPEITHAEGALESPGFEAPSAEMAPSEPTQEPSIFGTPQDASIFEQPTAEPPEQLASAEAPTLPAAAAPVTLETLGTSASEQDDALAWLESLAAKHGAKSEEFVSDPARRSEKPPEWVQRASALAGSQFDLEQPAEERGAPEEPEFVEPVPDEVKPPQPAADETGLWLRGLAEREEAASLEEPVPAAEVAETPFAEQTPMAPIEEVGVDEESLIPPEAQGAPLAEGISTTFELEEPNEYPETPLVTEMPEAAVDSATDLADWLSKLDETPASTPAAETLFPAEPEPAREASDLPPWLSGSAAGEGMESEAEPSMPAEAEETSDLPAWLRGLDEEQTFTAEPTASDELPAWLQREAELPAEPEPTMPTDWHPVESTTDFGEETQPVQAFSPEEMEPPQATPEQSAVQTPAPSELEVEAGVEAPAPAEGAAEEMPALFEPERSAAEEAYAEPEPHVIEPEAEQPPAIGRTIEVPVEPQVEAEPEAEPVTEPAAMPGSEMQGEEVSVPPAVEPQPEAGPGQSAAPPRRQTGMLAPVGDPGLSIAQTELSRGDIPAAVEHYNRLIRRGKLLEEIIRDLREALYRYPIEVPIWQTLGDAYMRQNRLQEALDAYTKAEELLR